MADLFSTNVVNGVVASLIRPSSFLLDRFFPTVQTDQSEEIHFDMIDKTRRLAPFVSPMVEGKVVASQGFSTKTFKPAYIKDKRVWDGNRALKRSAGEQIGGTLQPMDRMRALLAQDLQDQLENLQRRQEWMASSVLRTGAVTIVGDQYPSVSVSFGRDAGLTIPALGNTAKWSAAASKPLDNLQAWALLVLKKCGAMPVDVVMDVDTWVVFRDHTQVKDRITLQRRLGEMPSLDQAAQITEGAVFMGNVDGFNIWVYSGWYIDDAGVEQPILPSGTVIMGTPQIQGVRAYGAIRDEAAGYQAVPYYVKSWIEEDPAVRFVMMQSAPLVVPTRVNASLCATSVLT
jgi:hypothetical protein